MPGAERVSRGLLPTLPLPSRDKLLAPASPPGENGAGPLSLASGHLQRRQPVIPRNHINEFMCPELGELGEQTKRAPPAAWEAGGGLGIAPDRTESQPHLTSSVELQAVSLWALPRFWGWGSPLQLSCSCMHWVWSVRARERAPFTPPGPPHWGLPPLPGPNEGIGG